MSSGRARTQEERYAKYVTESDGCWVWGGHCNPVSGYGMVTHPTKRAMLQAHRWVYEMKVGPIPDGMVLDHLCRNPPCVNPDHLEPVTTGENLGRGLGGPFGSQFRLVCKRGHDMTVPENIYHRPKGGRMCQPCHLERARLAHKRRREAQRGD